MVFETFSVRVYQKGGRDFSPHPKPPVISPITTTHKVVGSDPLPIMSGLGVASRSFNSEGPNAFAGGGPQRAARGAWRARRAACGAWRARQGRRFWCFSVRPCRGGVGSRNFHGFMWVGNLHDRAPQLVRACSLHNTAVSEIKRPAAVFRRRARGTFGQSVSSQKTPRVEVQKLAAVQGGL